ncbi:uncharacterized protein LOC125532090 [Triticum urartu]|uniref:uncharacterized protein LOC125532090 n=1 Tax=Triticum urartu TaxID=4572 RepID=UPI002043B4DC|nr:uncharacterized protein LOC125532090 [Triticum urartu]
MDPLFRRAGPIIALKRPSLSIEPQVHVRKLKHELEPHARKLGFYPTAEGVPEGDRAAENASRSRFDSQEAQIAEEPCEVLRFFLGPHGVPLGWQQEVRHQHHRDPLEGQHHGRCSMTRSSSSPRGGASSSRLPLELDGVSSQPAMWLAVAVDASYPYIRIRVLVLT